MKPFTAVIRRPTWPDSIRDRDVPDDLDIYVANVDAENVRDAVDQAQREAYHADVEDRVYDDDRVRPSDYVLIVLFEGMHRPSLFGWQTLRPLPLAKRRKDSA